MRIKSLNYQNSINFSSRKEEIRKADDIQRASRRTFPVHSPSYIDEFYSSTKLEGDKPVNPRARRLFKKVDAKLTALRTISKNPDEYQLNISSPERGIPYTSVLETMEIMKVGNCHECALATIAALAANGYYDAQRMLLGLNITYTDKKTGEIVYNKTEPLDHSFVMTALNKENPKEKDKIILDSWLGFADSISGAKARYKQIYDDKYINDLKSFHRSMFRVNQSEKEGQLIDLNDYEMRSQLVFHSPDKLFRAQLEKLGLYSGLMYKELLLPENDD